MDTGKCAPHLFEPQHAGPQAFLHPEASTDGGIACKNRALIEQQRGAILEMVKEMGKKLLTGKGEMTRPFFAIIHLRCAHLSCQWDMFNANISFIGRWMLTERVLAVDMAGHRRRETRASFCSAGNPNLMSISMPVKLFEARSYLEKLTDVWVFPSYLTRAAMTHDPVERMRLAVTYIMAGFQVRAPRLGHSDRAGWRWSPCPTDCLLPASRSLPLPAGRSLSIRSLGRPTRASYQTEPRSIWSRSATTRQYR